MNMKKVLLIILIIIFFVSCSRDISGYVIEKKKYNEKLFFRPGTLPMKVRAVYKITIFNNGRYSEIQVTKEFFDAINIDDSVFIKQVR